jgi:hypothetical protein
VGVARQTGNYIGTHDSDVPFGRKDDAKQSNGLEVELIRVEEQGRFDITKPGRIIVLGKVGKER